MTRLPVSPSDYSTPSAPVTFAAQWLACALPCRRFADALADAHARLGADAVRYSFIVTDFHHLFLASLPAHWVITHDARVNAVECEHERDRKCPAQGVVTLLCYQLDLVADKAEYPADNIPESRTRWVLVVLASANRP